MYMFSYRHHPCAVDEFALSLSLSVSSVRCLLLALHVGIGWASGRRRVCGLRTGISLSLCCTRSNWRSYRHHHHPRRLVHRRRRPCDLLTRREKPYLPAGNQRWEASSYCVLASVDCTFSSQPARALLLYIYTDAIDVFARASVCSRGSEDSTGVDDNFFFCCCCRRLLGGSTHGGRIRTTSNITGGKGAPFILCILFKVSESFGCSNLFNIILSFDC